MKPPKKNLQFFPKHMTAYWDQIAKEIKLATSPNYFLRQVLLRQV